jgi:hypothetical protein
MAMDDDMDTMPAPDAGSSGGMSSSGMAMDSGEMGGMGSGGSPMSRGRMVGSGMKAMGCCMAEMKGMAGMGSTPRPTTSLPGFPGRSHLYHIGAEGFFLNHPQHITLSVDQQARLNRIRERALLTNATYERQVALVGCGPAGYRQDPRATTRHRGPARGATGRVHPCSRRGSPSADRFAAGRAARQEADVLTSTTFM